MLAMTAGTTAAPGRAPDDKPGEPPSAFAQRLRALRERRGLSQNALASRMGTDASMVLRVERGERTPRERGWIEAAAGALELTEDEADDLLLLAGHVPSAMYTLAVQRDPVLVAVARALLHAGADARSAHRQPLADVLLPVVEWYTAAHTRDADAA